MAIVSTDNQHYSNIATAIREKAGTEKQYTPAEMPAGVGEVYNAGMTQAESDFWDIVLNYGERDSCESIFAYWGAEYIRPNRKFTPTSRNYYMFYSCPRLKKVESKYFDLSNCSISQTSSTNGNYRTFGDCVALEEIEDIGLPAGYYYDTFRGCNNLKTIAALRVQEDTVVTGNAFNCLALENITIIGTIGTNNYTFSRCPNLTHDSLMSIINALATKTSGTWSISLGVTNLAKLTDAEKAIATQKGWTLA